uniref:MI domain-containing protein n=1 Tax=Parastrongyloides trichosuri TaxID=131310 RepID=A0A0N4ZCZ5_PARTI
MHTNKSQSRAHQQQAPLTLTQNGGEGNRHNNMPTGHPQPTPLLAMTIPPKVPPPYQQNFNTPPPSMHGSGVSGNPRSLHSINNTNISHGMPPPPPPQTNQYIFPPGVHPQQGQNPHHQPTNIAPSIGTNIYQQNPPPTQNMIPIPGFVNSPQGGPPFIGGPMQQGVQIPQPMISFYPPMIQSGMGGPIPNDGYNYNPQQHHVVPQQMVNVIPGSSGQQPTGPPQSIYHQRNNGSFRGPHKGAPQMPPLYGAPAGYYHPIHVNMMVPNNGIPPQMMPGQMNPPQMIPEVKEKTKIFVQRNKDGLLLYGHMTETGLVFSKEPPKEMVHESEPPEHEVIDNYSCVLPNGMEPSTSGGMVQSHHYAGCPNGSMEDYAYSETDSVNVPSDPRQVSHTPVDHVEDQVTSQNESFLNATDDSIGDVNNLSNMLKQSGIQGMDWSTIVEEEKKHDGDNMKCRSEDSCSNHGNSVTSTGEEYVVIINGDDNKGFKKLTKGLLVEILEKNDSKYDCIKTGSGELITNDRQCEPTYFVFYKDKTSMNKALQLNSCIFNNIKLTIKLRTQSPNHFNNTTENKTDNDEGNVNKNQATDGRNNYQDVRMSKDYHGSNRFGNFRNNDNNYQRKQGGHYYDNHHRSGNFVNKESNPRGHGHTDINKLQQRNNQSGYYKNNYNQRHTLPSNSGSYNGDKSCNQQFDFYNNHNKNNFNKQSNSGHMKSETTSVASHYGSNSSLRAPSISGSCHEKLRNSGTYDGDAIIDSWCKERKERAEAGVTGCENKHTPKTEHINDAIIEEKTTTNKVNDNNLEKDVVEEKTVDEKKNNFQKDSSRKNYQSVKSGHYKKDNFQKYGGSQSARFQHNNAQRQNQHSSTVSEQDNTLPPTGNNTSSNSQNVKNNFKSHTLPRRIQQQDSNDLKKRDNVRTFTNSNTKSGYGKGQGKRQEYMKSQIKRNNSQSSSCRSINDTKLTNKSIEDLKCIDTEISQPLSTASSPPSLTEMNIPLNEKKCHDTDEMGSVLSVSSVKSFKSTSSRPPRIQTNIKHNEAISPQMVSPADSNIDDYFSASENTDDIRNKICVGKSNSINNIVKESNVIKTSPSKKNKNAKKKEKKNDKNCPTAALLSKNKFAPLSKE